MNRTKTALYLYLQQERSIHEIYRYMGARRYLGRDILLKQLNKMREKGLVKSVGVGGNTHWQLSPKVNLTALFHGGLV